MLITIELFLPLLIIVTMETVKPCKVCEIEHPLSELKTDDYSDENLFCKKCYSYRVQCAICKKMAVSCWHNSATGERGFDDDENDCAIFEIRSGYRIFEYTQTVYDTESQVCDIYQKIVDCFICEKLVCENCCDNISTSLYGYPEEIHTLCEKCNDKYPDIYDRLSEMILLRRYKHEKRKRREVEQKLARMEMKLTTRESLVYLSTDIIDLICKYM